MTAIPNALQLTRDLVRLNTINPPGNEEPCARLLGAMLEQAGFRVAGHEFAERRTSLVATLGGSHAKPPICFTGHIDTVPLGAAPWRMDPFAGEIEDGKVYGRGTSDMKSGVAAFVVAALQLAQRLGKSPGVVLVITAAEETGCEGAFYLERQKDALGRAGALVVAEPTSNYPLVGHKGAFWIKARTRGVTAHGSMPERGVNAVYKAARAALKLEQFRFEGSGHDLMGKATLNLGTFSGGLNINSVPDEAAMGIDIRTVPGQDHQQIYDQLSWHLGEEVELTPMLDVESVYTDPADPWMQDVFQVMTPILGEAPQPRSVSYFTDAAALSRAYQSPPTVILGPGEPHMAHQTDEYCIVERIDQAVEAYVEILRRWCAI